MKKVMIVMVAIILSVSISGFAWAGCGGCSFNGNGGHGCYGLQMGNASGWCCSVASDIHRAANCCWSGIADFFEGSAHGGAALGAGRAQTY